MQDEQSSAQSTTPQKSNTSEEFDESVLNDTMTVVLLDADTGEVLFSKDADEQIYPASTTKIMTALLAIELNGGNLDGEVTVGQEVNAFSSTSSLLGLRSDSTVSIRDLVYGLMLVSGNDAAAALAVHFGGSEEEFVKLMNQKAADLGMMGTAFANPHGLDQRSIGLDHHSTASDMAKLARAAYKNSVLMEVMGTGSYQITSTELNPNIRPDPVLHNGNYLLEIPVQEPQRSRYAQFRYTPTTGMKTGLLQNVDGYKYYGCLVASANRDGRNLIATIFADTSNSASEGPAMDRWRTAISLFEFGFTGFVDVEIGPYLEGFSTQGHVDGYAQNDPYDGSLEIVPASDVTVPETISVERGKAYALQTNEAKIDMVPELNSSLTAPITQGTPVGTLSYQLDGEELFNVPLVAARSVYAAGDEEVTSKHYGVPDPNMVTWWIWIAVGVGAAAAVVFFIFWYRRRNVGRYIGKTKTRYGNGHYGSRRYSWNDEVPLSVLHKKRMENKRDKFKRW